MADFRSEWQLGNDWNQLLANTMTNCNNAMWAAHADPTHYDEWLRSLQVLRTLCIVKKADCETLDKELRRVEELMKRADRYCSDLDLTGDRKYRKMVDDSLRSLQTLMISILNNNDLIVRRSQLFQDSKRPDAL